MAECAHCKMHLTEKARHKKIYGTTSYFAVLHAKHSLKRASAKKVDYKKIFEKGL